MVWCVVCVDRSVLCRARSGLVFAELTSASLLCSAPVVARRSRVASCQAPVTPLHSTPLGSEVRCRCANTCLATSRMCAQPEVAHVLLKHIFAASQVDIESVPVKITRLKRLYNSANISVSRLSAALLGLRAPFICRSRNCSVLLYLASRSRICVNADLELRSSCSRRQEDEGRI